MKKIASHILIILFFAVSISAQENQPQLIDEFDNYPLDETMARLQNLMIEVGKTPNSKALIRIYGGRENYFAASYNRGSVMQAVLKNNLLYPIEKVVIQFCNINQEPVYTRFYIVRDNDKLETCDENLTSPKQTILFDVVSFHYQTFKLTPFENLIVEHGFSDGEYSQFSQDVLKRLLNESPESKLYLIAYLRTNFEEDESGKIIVGKSGSLDKKTYANKMFRAARKELIKNGFSASQIVALNGGYVNGNGRRLEFWFVPQGGEIPKPKPDYIPKKNSVDNLNFSFKTATKY
jgi:hypothetical protein